MDKNERYPSKSNRANFSMVGGARNGHGTRICRRIVCARCEETDYISVRTKSSTNALCRKCARILIAAYEEGVQVRFQRTLIQCSRCSKECEVPDRLKGESEVLCLDCLRGFEVWRGSLSNPYFARNPIGRFVIGNNGTVLRKGKQAPMQEKLPRS